MKDLVINNTAIVFEQNENGVFTDSRTIANVFGKEHKNVIRIIESIGILDDFEYSSKLSRTTYEAKNGKTNKMYLLDRDAFSLVVMGFTGKQAMKWKMDYIKAFNAMEEELQKRTQPKPLTTEDILALTAKKLEEVEEKRKHTQKLLEETKRINEVLEQEIEAIANTDGLIDMKAFSMLVTSRTQNVNFGRTKCYLVLRALSLVGKDTRPSQYGLTSYLEVKMVEGSDGNLYPKTFVIADKFDKLFNRIVKKVLEDEELNRELGYPFGR